MAITGTTMTIRVVLREPPALPGEEGALQDAPGTLSLLVIDPDGNENEYKQAECAHDSTGKYHKDVLSDADGLWHYRWLVNGESADEGSWVSESEFSVEFTEDEEPDLTDLRILVPRARRKIEGPWGNANGRTPLTNTQIYEMIADACAEVIMLSGKLFGHTLKVKKRDSLGGYPTEWQTEVALEEYEAAILCAQVALNYYFHVFNNLKMSETILNEGTSWEYTLSANVVKEYLKGIVAERDAAIQGLRINKPVLDRFASNIRVRDQQTVVLLEWWDYNSPGITGSGMPGGQEASVVPTFFP